jgi:peptidyl-dipeptidase Dcp
LLYQAPDFSRIKNGDFQPAIEEGMRQQLAEVAAIMHDPAAPTFENTILPLERAGQLLGRVQRVFGGLASSNTNDTIQGIQRALAPRLAAHRDAIALNDTLFQRIKSLYDRRNNLGLDSLQRLVVERYYRDFVRSGANLAPADKERLRALNREMAQLGNDFSRRVLAGTRAGGVVVDDSTQLDGLSPADMAAAAAAARARGMTGRWLLPLQNTTQQPAQASLHNRAVRQRLFEASTLRNERGDSNDTRQIILRLAQLRAERARLLGYPTFAAYGLEEQMARTPENAIALMTRLAGPAVAKARAEAADMQRLVDSQRGGFQIQPWDWQFYAEEVRSAQYALDEEQIKPYLELDHVLQDGLFYAANRLYGLSFRERHDIPVYHPDVRVFEVFDADTSLGLFYADYFKRDNKNGGAWSSGFVSRSTLLGTRPVITNTCNFTKPAEGQPALLTWDNVTTMFHEFGHALHGLFSNVRYPTLAGTAVPRDFVEMPSQFNEHWANEPAVFARYARHYRTGEPMPAALKERIDKARLFNGGYAMTELLAAAFLDLEWHQLAPDAVPADVDAFEAAALARHGLAAREVPPRYGTPYFSHIWTLGYAAGYYSYIWSAVLDNDAYYWFRENGGMTRANGQRFRDLVLSRGGTQEAAELYRQFRGRDASVEPLLAARGLT